MEEERNKQVEAIMCECEDFLDYRKGVESYSRYYETVGGQEILCGLDITTKTPVWGIEMPIFLDGRDRDMADPVWWKEALAEKYKQFSVDDEIDLHRESIAYRKTFTIRQSLQDFEAYRDFLKEIAEDLNKC